MPGANDEHTIIEARVDWISASSRDKDRDSGLFALGQAFLERQRALGNRSVPWGSHGYSGRACGAVRIASGAAGCLVQLSGELSGHHHLAVAQAADHLSRLDFAVTTCASDPTANVADEWWRKLGCDKPDRQGRLTYRLVRQAWAGSTLYCGSRQSPALGRIYDKFQESEGRYPRGSWRWEVEWKRERAEQWQARIREKPLTQADLVSATIARFGKWAIACPFGNGSVIELAEVPRQQTDVERKLDWLRTQVRPTVRWLFDYLDRATILAELDILLEKGGD